uniref:G_PROTEIN_RECEP_F1_2 domain-containing protein n=1 Tax=Steinernema glaseri TaxID=37863 RepID=A0A1I7Y6Z6_9BILA
MYSLIGNTGLLLAESFEHNCYWNPFITGDDLSDVSVATLAIMRLVVAVAVLQFVCIVDDELSPRMKPNAAGEPSKFNFKYGTSFFLSALSFLPVQLCAYFNAYLYFRRYRTPFEKVQVIPGLEEKVYKLHMDQMKGSNTVSGGENQRRGSLPNNTINPYSRLLIVESSLQEPVSLDPRGLLDDPRNYMPPPPRVSFLKPNVIFA